MNACASTEYGACRRSGSSLPAANVPRRSTMGLWTSWTSDDLPIPSTPRRGAGPCRLARPLRTHRGAPIARRSGHRASRRPGTSPARPAAPEGTTPRCSACGCGAGIPRNGPHAARALVAILGVLREELADDRRGLRWNGRIQLGEGPQRQRDVRVDERDGVGENRRAAAPQGRGTAGRAERVEVGPVVDRAVHPPRLLGGYVEERDPVLVGAALGSESGRARRLTRSR